MKLNAYHREHLVELFVARWQGKPLSENGTFGLNQANDPEQCVNVDNEWGKFLGLKAISGNAINLPNDFDPHDWEWHLNTPDFIPHRGDLFVMNGPPADPIYGHTGLVRWAAQDQFQTLEQNWNEQPWCSVITRNYDGVWGFLRALKLKDSKP